MNNTKRNSYRDEIEFIHFDYSIIDITLFMTTKIKSGESHSTHCKFLRSCDKKRVLAHKNKYIIYHTFQDMFCTAAQQILHPYCMHYLTTEMFKAMIALTWVEGWHMLSHSVIFQHMKECSFSSIIQTKEH